MKNNSSQKRFAKITAKFTVILLAVVLSLSVLPTLSVDMLPSVSAADEIEYTVPTTAKIADINAQLATYAEGSVVNLTLMADINMLTDGTLTGIVIPKGITVNFYMNGYCIRFYATDKDTHGDFQVMGIYGIVNNGTLNLYSGSKTNPNRVQTTGKSTIEIIKHRPLTNDAYGERWYCRAEAIQNYGTCKVYSGVILNVSVEITDNEENDNQRYSASAVTAVAGINNMSNSATVTVDGAKIVAKTYSKGKHASGSIESNRETVGVHAYAYGIWGGTVRVYGDTTIDVYSHTFVRQNSAYLNSENGITTAVAYGVCTSGAVYVYGGTFDYDAEAHNRHAATQEGSRSVYMGGICYQNGGAVPVMPDGDINVTSTNKVFTGNDSGSETGGAMYYYESTVAKATRLPWGPHEVFGVASGNLYTNTFTTNAWPQVVIAGQFLDETGNSYDTTISNQQGTHPKAIVRGAEEGTYRVHVVYRYWKDSTKSEVDRTIVGQQGNPGFSYSPLSDGTNVVDKNVVLNGLVGNGKLVKTADSAISYSTGGDSCNEYYWQLLNVTWTQTSQRFSDFRAATSANRGTVFKNFSETGSIDNSVAGGLAAPIFVFVDYVRLDPTSIKASAGTNGVATTTYTGHPIVASTLRLRISDSVYETNYTSEYNIDLKDPSLIPVTFSYTGTNAAGIEESNTGMLPTNAGTYEVTMHIDENTTYSKEPKINKNRYALDYTFTLIIEQASILRGNLPENITLTYGQKLNEVLLLQEFAAQGIASDTNITGVFSFATAIDGTSFKPAGSSVVTIRWTPTYGTTPRVKNYKPTDFNINYTVNKAPLTIRPNAAAVIYGNSEFDIPYSVSITGLVASDDSDTVKTQLANALTYMILNGDSYVPYVAGEAAAGNYYIRATFADVPGVLSNYEYSYVYGTGNNEEGVLQVSKRPVNVEAFALDRAYAPDNSFASVSFEITDGRFGVDDVRLLPTQGGLSNNNAGTREVSGITKQEVSKLLTGGAAANYYVSELTYNTGDKLYVNIAKGVPTVTTPVVSEMFYQRQRTLADISLVGTTSSVAGVWQWVDATINPTVNVSSYRAQFVPEDTTNYEIKSVDVVIKVKATPVVISYTGYVSYGDNIPNITAYTYISDLDPSFNIDAVNTSGNITPSTSYYKGAPAIDGGYDVEISAPNFIDVNGNYTFTTTNGVINVTPRKITFKVVDTSITYGENFVASAASVNVQYDRTQLVGSDSIEDVTANGQEPTFEYSTDFRYIDNYQVGSYYIKAVPNFVTSANYTVEVLQGKLSVTKAQLVIKADDITLSYNSPIPADIASSFTVVGAKRNEDIEDIVTKGEIKVDTTYQKGSPVNTDGYPITVDVTNATFNNYSVTVQHGTITVIKATPKVIALPQASIVHGQTLANAVFTAGTIEDDVAGTFIYDSASTAPAYRADAYTIYTATFVPVDSKNYNTVTGLYVSLTVNKKPILGSLAVAGIPMVGEKLNVDVTGLDPNEIGVYTITWYNGNGTAFATGTEITLPGEVQYQNVTVKAVANAPYVGTVEYVTTLIAPELTPVASILTPADYGTYFALSGLEGLSGEASYVYNAAPHYVEFARNNASLNSAAIGGVTVKYNGSTVAPTKVGYYKVTIDIATPDGIKDMNISTDTSGRTYDTKTNKVVYSPVANFEIGTLIITKAPYTVEVEVLDKVYDATVFGEAEVKNEIGACTLTGGIKDDVLFDIEKSVFMFDSASVGTDKTVLVTGAALKGNAAENYELEVVLLNGAKADITKRTLKVKVIPVEREYEAGNYNIDLGFEIVANTIAEGDDGLVYVNEALASAKADDYKAGLRKVTVTGAELTGSKASNYNLELTNLDGLMVDILKATPGYPLPMTDVLYYDSARALSAISLGDSRWAWDHSITNEVPSAGTHTYKAIYTPDDTLNYATVEQDVELQILKATVTVTAADFTVTYGDIEPTYYYTVQGLTGADTIKNSVDGYVLMNCSYNAGSDVGMYTVVLTGAFESENYDFIYKNGTVNVNKRAAYVEAIAQNRQYEQGNLSVDVNFSALTNIYGNDAGSVFLSGTFPITGTIESDTAGTKSVKYTLPVLAGAKAANYELRLLNPTLTVEIEKALIAGVILPSTGTVGYGQKLNTTIFTSSYEGTEFGTFTMENPTTTPSAVGTFTDVYKVVFTPFNTLNYATVTKYITLTVEPSQLNISISLTGTTQSGKSLYVITSEVPANAQQYLYFDWYRVDSPDADIRTGFNVASGTDYYTLTDADSGKYIICTVKNIDGAPYTCFAQCVTESSIEEESLTFWQKLINWFYRLISNITQIFGKIL